MANPSPIARLVTSNFSVNSGYGRYIKQVASDNNVNGYLLTGLECASNKGVEEHDKVVLYRDEITTANIQASKRKEVPLDSVDSLLNKFLTAYTSVFYDEFGISPYCVMLSRNWVGTFAYNFQIDEDSVIEICADAKNAPDVEAAAASTPVKKVSVLKMICATVRYAYDGLPSDFIDEIPKAGVTFEQQGGILGNLGYIPRFALDNSYVADIAAMNANYADVEGYGMIMQSFEGSNIVLLDIVCRTADRLVANLPKYTDETSDWALSHVSFVFWGLVHMFNHVRINPSHEVRISSSTRRAAWAIGMEYILRGNEPDNESLKLAFDIVLAAILVPPFTTVRMVDVEAARAANVWSTGHATGNFRGPSSKYWSPLFKSIGEGDLFGGSRAGTAVSYNNISETRVNKSQLDYGAFNTSVLYEVCHVIDPKITFASFVDLDFLRNMPYDVMPIGTILNQRGLKLKLTASIGIRLNRSSAPNGQAKIFNGSRGYDYMVQSRAVMALVNHINVSNDLAKIMYCKEQIEANPAMFGTWTDYHNGCIGHLRGLNNADQFFVKSLLFGIGITREAVKMFSVTSGDNAMSAKKAIAILVSMDPAQSSATWILEDALSTGVKVLSDLVQLAVTNYNEAQVAAPAWLGKVVGAGGIFTDMTEDFSKNVDIMSVGLLSEDQLREKVTEAAMKLGRRAVLAPVDAPIQPAVDEHKDEADPDSDVEEPVEDIEPNPAVVVGWPVDANWEPAELIDIGRDGWSEEQLAFVVTVQGLNLPPDLIIAE